MSIIFLLYSIKDVFSPGIASLQITSFKLVEAIGDVDI
jgi:hypothetical protein